MTTRPGAGRAIPEDDDDLLAECDVTYFQASGPGGQNRNKSRSAVRLRHRPTGIVVVGQRQRSQRQNRLDALQRLRGRLEDLLHEPETRTLTRPTSASRKSRLAEKRRRSRVKRLRGEPPAEE